MRTFEFRCNSLSGARERLGGELVIAAIIEDLILFFCEILDKSTLRMNCL